MSVRVLEYIRDPIGVWNLPAAQLERLRGDFPGVRFDSPATREEANAILAEADVVCGYAVTPANFALAKRLRWIHVAAAGVGGVLFPELIASEVALTNGRGLHAVAMAEHALAVMLSFVRKLHLARDAQHEKRWAQRALLEGPPEFGELAGGTLGLVGLGRAGSAIAVRARALELHVIALRRHPVDPPDPAHQQWGTERLGELCERADWLVLAAALTPVSRSLIGARELARMKRHAVLVNLGRGGLVDEPALIEALASGRIAGAALDVTEEEPLPAASPLWTLENVILTPHVSGLGPRYWERATDLFARNLRAFLKGEPLENVVDKRAGY
ncbi:MAG: D-2-hydroxyacid dehydrogenase [Candidatus Eisenbacteria bacterium]|nr:D-2-hydroxyacid dehydrogenase [Candidatus Eisenbacteria bacterium]